MIEPGVLLNKRYKVIRKVAEGGFSQIFEVQDTRQRHIKNGFGILRGRSVKILKVLNQFGNRQQDAEFLFRREISLLRQLDHPAIVKYADDFDLIQDQRIIPCLVMEKISGVTMEKWLQENGAVSEEVALDWLLQFAEVLDYLHNDQRVMHLDIKPTNVMVTPKGELVLIDFGIARPISSTLLAKLVDSGESMQHRAATDWFSAPEQLQGKPTPQSDLYSVGRTIIHTITNKVPEDLEDNDEGQLLWRKSNLGICQELQVCLDKMISFSIKARFPNIRSLHQAVAEIQKQYHLSWTSFSIKLFKISCRLILYSVGMTTIVSTAKYFGILQPLELAAYNHFVQLRPDTEGFDPRILIIEITKDDFIFMSEVGIRGDGSLSDEALRLALEKIELYDPSVIGIDIFRENSAFVAATDNVVAICSQVDEIKPPPDFPISQIGFADVLEDGHDNRLMRSYIRRNLVLMSSNNICNTDYSFGYQVAKLYLNNFDIDFEVFEDFIVANNVILQRLRKHNAMYQRFDDAGYQILLNYRTHPEVAKSITFRQFIAELTDKELFELIQHRIVLIGNTEGSYGDMHYTPYGRQPGVVIQAHMISQLISAALDERQNLTFWKMSTEFLFLLSFCLSILSLTVLLNRSSLIYLAVCYLAVYCFGYIALERHGLVVPVIPFLSISTIICLSSKHIRR